MCTEWTDTMKDGPEASSGPDLPEIHVVSLQIWPEKWSEQDTHGTTLS